MSNRPPPPPLPYLAAFAGAEVAAELKARQERILDEQKKLYVQGRGERTAVHLSDVGQTGGPPGFPGGDCWVASGLAAVVRVHPDPDQLMEDIIKNNGDGTYTVTFFEVVDGSRTPIPVLLDARDVEEVAAGLANRQAITSDDRAADGKPELWPALVEKAYLKEYPAQGGAPSQVMERLTGLSSEFVPLPGMLEQVPWPAGAPVPKVTLEGLAELHKKDYAIAFGTFTDEHRNYQETGRAPYYVEDGKREPLWPNHAYYVTGVDPVKGTVTVQNPWDDKHQDIVIPYADVEKVFASASLNPVKHDPTASVLLGTEYPRR